MKKMKMRNKPGIQMKKVFASKFNKIYNFVKMRK